MSEGAEKPGVPFMRLALNACAVCLLLILTFAAHSGAMEARDANVGVSHPELASAPDSSMPGTRHAASRAVAPPMGQSLVLPSLTGDTGEDELQERHPSAPFAGRHATLQASTPATSPEPRRRAFQARAPPASA